MPVSSSPPAPSCSASTRAASTRSSACSSRRCATRRESRGCAPRWRSRTAISTADEHARALLVEESDTRFAGVPYDQFWLVTLVQWALVAGQLGESDAAAILVQLLAPWAGQFAFTGAHLFGSVGHALALCEATLGRYDAAAKRFANALAAYEAFGAPAWAARLRLGWADMLAARGGTADDERATPGAGGTLYRAASRAPRHRAARRASHPAERLTVAHVPTTHLGRTGRERVAIERRSARELLPARSMGAQPGLEAREELP